MHSSYETTYVGEQNHRAQVLPGIHFTKRTQMHVTSHVIQSHNHEHNGTGGEICRKYSRQHSNDAQQEHEPHHSTATESQQRQNTTPSVCSRRWNHNRRREHTRRLNIGVVGITTHDENHRTKGKHATYWISFDCFADAQKKEWNGGNTNKSLSFVPITFNPSQQYSRTEIPINHTNWTSSVMM